MVFLGLLFGLIGTDVNTGAQRFTFDVPELSVDWNRMALGLVAAVVLASGSVIKAIAMVFLGLLFGLVGTDVNTGAQRFTFDVPELSDGIDFAPIAMGWIWLRDERSVSSAAPPTNCISITIYPFSLGGMVRSSFSSTAE